MFAGQIKPEESLFIYEAGLGPEDYAHPEHIPVFTNSLKISDEVRQVCDGRVECMFDAAATNDTAVGLNTKLTGEVLEEERKLAGLPPRYFCVEKLLILFLAHSMHRKIRSICALPCAVHSFQIRVGWGGGVYSKFVHNITSVHPRITFVYRKHALQSTVVYSARFGMIACTAASVDLPVYMFQEIWESRQSGNPGNLGIQAI